MGALQMRDVEIDDRPVILPNGNAPHGFQPSDFHRKCDLCGARRGALIHDRETILRASIDRQRNIALARARGDNR